MPEYQFQLIERGEQTSEEEIFNTISEMTVKTYKLYAITLNNEKTTYVNSREEAEQTIAKIKTEQANNLDKIEIGMQEIYTNNINELTNTVEVASAINSTEKELTKIVEEQVKIKSATLDDVYFSVKPVTGTITSRFGANESIRDHTHKGIDISAPNGTTIKAAAAGKVTYSGWMGGYGNLVIISHSNGIQTYYGHCSKLYVSVGDQVDAGEKIAAVGSTGQSTGNHLHFEIRKDGVQVNPQKYLYK
ncbi:MAG: M23 family metallopeptidase [Clostridiaceae bacterium]|nr:M23 family metallopeptidase [Clostridiaceae bacterium]